MLKPGQSMKSTVGQLWMPIFVRDYITDSVKSITDDSANGKFQYRHIHPDDLQAYIQSLKDTANSASSIAGGFQID